MSELPKDESKLLIWKPVAAFWVAQRSQLRAEIEKRAFNAQGSWQ
ncbi:hypothetical protein B1R32_11074 [Abditibacterium utsteinense]|uniref:Uncharacterized protein n=1 Tax=Abditibacterium utsteinense TaxID=1960156 RepID=A0A2S8SS56_9BACT|nr:hypothetical protein [Abditibacterium utsteinense]PQV63608.1 hypothetical protein B1R32_11074 [Abditibacterium utsteinense]